MTPPASPDVNNPTTVPTTTVVDLDTPKNYQDELENLPFIRDPAQERLAFDAEQYPATYNTLLRFAEGSKIRVLYFQNIGNTVNNNRENLADYFMDRGDIHDAVTQISNFLIICTNDDPISMSWNQDKQAGTLTGEGIVLPNMNPSVGDMFVYEFDVGVFGLFRIGSAEPTKWGADKCYRITYQLQTQLARDDVVTLTNKTSFRFVYDDINFLGQRGALLSQDRYLYLNRLKEYRVILSRYYFTKFYDENKCSFMRPDGVYDPYLVWFMASKCSLKDVPYRPEQLYGHDLKSYDRTIWSRLLDRYNNTVGGLWSNVVLDTYVGGATDVSLTAIANTDYLTVNDATPGDSGNSYVFSMEFYQGLVALMTPLEVMVYSMITTRYLDQADILVNTYLTQYMSLSDMDQFYHIPMYLHMIDVSISSIAILGPSKTLLNNPVG